MRSRPVLALFAAKPDGKFYAVIGGETSSDNRPLQALHGDELGPVEGFGVQPGFTPELDDQCRVAYTWVDRDTESLDFELRVWEPGETEAKTL